MFPWNWLRKFYSDPKFLNSLPGGHSEVEPPDPISNSEVKRFSADGSVGPPHVRVGHCQALILKPRWSTTNGVFSLKQYLVTSS